ncbi:TPA: nucleotidyltransferase [Candidatus Poribacteria bacterium]|nr:nucleotidyltransferase [Candidatus Poribacteria bacterium]
MGVGEDFKTFCRNLTINNRKSIGQRYQLITRRLNLDFWELDSRTSHSLYVGSYGRGTAIRGFSDLDMIFCLPYDYYQKYDNYQYNGQSAMLQDVKKSLQKTYPTTDIGADGQVVVIHFTDGISFEIVPAFLNEDGSYTYPDANSGGRWRVTNPKPEIGAISSMDLECNGNLKWLCRMTRSWKNVWGAPMGGLLIDTLAYRFIKDWEYKEKSFLYYDWMSRDFFKYLADEPECKYWLAVGSRQYIWSKGKFQYKAKRCYNLALEAIYYESSGYVRSARQKWREIYGTAYPS